jgi:hypothetical protein
MQAKDLHYSLIIQWEPQDAVYRNGPESPRSFAGGCMALN